jgi:hypothetical protein
MSQVTTRRRDYMSQRGCVGAATLGGVPLHAPWRNKQTIRRTCSADPQADERAALAPSQCLHVGSRNCAPLLQQVASMSLHVR